MSTQLVFVSVDLNPQKVQSWAPFVFSNHLLEKKIVRYVGTRAAGARVRVIIRRRSQDGPVARSRTENPNAAAPRSVAIESAVPSSPVFGWKADQRNPESGIILEPGDLVTILLTLF